MAIEGSKLSGGGQRVRLGMVGGGQGAFIGAVHRIAARLDDRFAFVAGALSSHPDKARASGQELGLDDDRVYGSYQEMADAEAKREDGIEAVAIVTPNDAHFPAAKAFLEAGIHVICDKPMTTTLADARALAEIAKGSGRLFVLTHNYTGYPMIREARALVASGALGDLRLVEAEYLQDWLTERVETSGLKQAEWRTDPKRSGAGGCIGDIGTHAYNLASFVTGLTLERVAADLTTFVEGRAVDDNVSVLLRFAGGAKGMLWASQVAVGNENALSLRVYGTKAGLEWHHNDPNRLWYTPLGEPKRLLTRNGAGTGEASKRVARVPSGHTEGYLEGFATIYSEAAEAIMAARDDAAVDPAVVYPTVDDGVRGLAFIEACIASSKADGAWTAVEPA